MREVEFHEPVFLGDIVSFFTETVRVGRTSITVRVSVEAERWGGGHGERVKVTEAEVVLVAVDERGPADSDPARRDDGRLRVEEPDERAHPSPRPVAGSRSSARTTARTPA